MVIDIHTHVAFSGIYPKSYLTGMLSGEQLSVKSQKLYALISIFLRDKDCTKMIEQMDDAQVSRSVLLIIDGGLGMGESDLSLEDIYLLHYEILKRHPQRLTVFGGVDPRRGDAGLELFKKSVIEYGFRGLKLYPPMGFSTDDPRTYKLLHFCQEQSLPVLIHTGPSLPSLMNHFADLRHMVKVAKDFPGINFILAHAGANLVDPSINELHRLDNVYFDIAGYQTAFSKNDKAAQQKLAMVFDDDFHQKVLFGSDWPLFNMVSPVAAQIKDFRKLHHETFGEDHIGRLENILYNNALKVLRSPSDI